MTTHHALLLCRDAKRRRSVILISTITREKMQLPDKNNIKEINFTVQDPGALTCQNYLHVISLALAQESDRRRRCSLILHASRGSRLLRQPNSVDKQRHDRSERNTTQLSPSCSSRKRNKSDSNYTPKAHCQSEFYRVGGGGGNSYRGSINFEYRFQIRLATSCTECP